MTEFTFIPSPIGRRRAVDLVRAFLAEHRDALLNASTFLGGKPACRRCLRLLDTMREAPQLTRRLRMELVDLHRFLMGEAAPLGLSIEPVIDPADPRVCDLCLLADKLHHLLRGLVRLDDDAFVGAYLDGLAA